MAKEGAVAGGLLGGLAGLVTATKYKTVFSYALGPLGPYALPVFGGALIGAYVGKRLYNSK